MSTQPRSDGGTHVTPAGQVRFPSTATSYGFVTLPGDDHEVRVRFRRDNHTGVPQMRPWACDECGRRAQATCAHAAALALAIAVREQRERDDRVPWAHQTAFALITEALTDADNIDIPARITEYTADRIHPDTATTDLAHVLIWHAAGAILRAADGDTDQALSIIRDAALQQTHHHEGEPS